MAAEEEEEEAAAAGSAEASAMAACTAQEVGAEDVEEATATAGSAEAPAATAEVAQEVAAEEKASDTAPSLPEEVTPELRAKLEKRLKKNSEMEDADISATDGGQQQEVTAACSAAVPPAVEAGRVEEEAAAAGLGEVPALAAASIEEAVAEEPDAAAVQLGPSSATDEAEEAAAAEAPPVAAAVAAAVGAAAAEAISEALPATATEAAAAAAAEGERAAGAASAETPEVMGSMGELADTGAASEVGVGVSPQRSMLGFTPAPRNVMPAAWRQGPGQSGADTVGHHRIWKVRHNKRAEENDQDPEWYKHKRHVIVFSFSGKPVFTRYGSEDGLSGTTGTLSAIVAKFQQFFFSTGGNTDCLRYMVAGDHVFAFLEKGPLWLVCISKCGDAYQDMVSMLERVHLQIITLLTAGVEKTLQRSPNYDMRKIMDGTDPVVNSLVRWCTQDVYLQVEGLEALPLPPASRAAATEALRSARIPNVLVGWLMAGHRIISLVCNKQYKVNALDLSMIINIIMSSTSLRTGESWTPVCLPHLNDKAFAYAYISFIEDTDVGVVFLSMTSEGEQFYEISQKVAKAKQVVRANGVLDAVAHAVGKCPIDFRATAGASSEQGDDGSSAGSPRTSKPPAPSAKKSLLAPSPPGQWRLLEGVIHAAYFIPSLQQYFSSAVAPEYRTRRRTKTLFRNYGRCRALLRTAKLPSQICIATDHECFYVSLAADFHMYMTVPRGISTKVIGEFFQWVKAQDAHIFLGQFPCW